MSSGCVHVPLIGSRGTRIGNRRLGGPVPEIAVSAFGHSSRDFVESFTSGSRSTGLLYELRYDLFGKREKEDLENILLFLNGNNVDYIFTFRSENENEISEYYEVASSLGVPASDIEISVAGSVKKDAGLGTIILSHHSFDGLCVADYYEQIASHKPDVIKLASAYSAYEDFQRDLAALLDYKVRDSTCLSFIPMGSGNRFLRVVSAYVLSDLVYAREEKETAEGQLTMEEYRNFFRYF